MQPHSAVNHLRLLWRARMYSKETAVNTTLTLNREQVHPPIALTHKGLIDRAAIISGIALIRWARRSERLRSQRLARQQERAVRQLEADRFWQEVADQRARTEVHMLFRSLQ